MENKPKKLNKSHEAGRHFIAMNSMLKCIQLYLDFFKHEKLVSSFTKFQCNKLETSIQFFYDKIEKNMPKETKELWGQSWENKDFESISRILEYWSEMNNHDRATLELVCEEMKSGTFKVEQDGE